MSRVYRCGMHGGYGFASDCEQCKQSRIEAPRSPAQPDAETLLREARRDWLGGHRAGADELEFCARIDAFLRGGSGG